MSEELIKNENTGKPNYCCIAVTESCFMQCKMCYKGREGMNQPDPLEADTMDWKGFLSSLRKFVDRRFLVNFAGGEALSRKDTLELIKYASNLEFTTLLVSNGYLINEEMAKKIGDCGLEIIVLSLDSIDEQIHDSLRGVKGAFRKVLNAIEYLNKYALGTRIDICAIVAENNLDGLCDLARWVQRNLASSHIFFQAVTQPFSTPIEENWFASDKYSFLWPKDLKKMRSVIDELMEFKKAGFRMHNTIYQFKMFKAYFENPERFIKKIGCHLDTQAINVNPLGEVHICFHMGAIGSIKAEGFDMSRIWRSPQAAAVRSKIKNCKRNCQCLVNCNFDESQAYEL